MSSPNPKARPDEQPTLGAPLPKAGAVRETTSGADKPGGDTAPSGIGPPNGQRPADLPESLGRYRIVKLLGQGGMGAVYLAHDSQLDRQVALKVPHFGPNANKDLIERFYREARAAATLQHPNICPVHDVGAHEGVHYLTMAFIEGKPLSAMMTPDKGLPPRQVAAVIRKLALALHEAHARGIVHRDLKPANVMINQRKEPVIMDFGLARRTTQNETRLTKSGAIVGTPAYMSPEQLSGGGEAGPPSDIYSLGVVMYEMLSGRLPFEGEMMAVLAQTLTSEPPPPSMHRPDLPEDIEVICLKAMAKETKNRYATMAELAAALAQFLSGAAPATTESVAASVQEKAAVGSKKIDTRKTAAPVTAQMPAPEKIAAESPSRQKPKSRTKASLWSRPLPWIAGGSALVVVLAIVLLWGVVFQVRTKTGVVTLAINEPGATVYVDEELKITITSPSHKEPIKIEVPEGKHVMKVVKGGFVTETKEFTLQAGTPQEIRVTLRPEPIAEVKKKDSPKQVDPKQVDPPKTTPEMAALAKAWSGTWSQPDGGVLDGEMHLTVEPSGAVQGRIEWTLRKAPKNNDKLAAKIGQGGAEHIRGTFDRKTRILEVDGYRKDDPQNIIGLDKYRLTLSEDLARLEGNSHNYGKWDSTFRLTRKSVVVGIDKAVVPFPRDRWVAVDANTPDTSSWAWGKPLRNPENKKWENGVLTLDNGAIAFNSIQARDVSFRAQVKFIEGNNMALVIRSTHGKGGVYALFDKLKDGKMYVAFLDTKDSKVINPKGDFFEFRVTAIGDQATIQVNGETVVKHQTKNVHVGHIELTAYDARGIFKDIEVKVLDK